MSEDSAEETSSEAPAGDSNEAGELLDLEGEVSILVVDGDLASRNLAEDLEDDLGRLVVAMDSVDFDPDTSEEIGAAGAFIVAWDLELRSGADLIEMIRADPRFGSMPIIVASEEPDRGMVRAALEVGADAVCCKPYDADEIRQRISFSLRRRLEAA